MDVRLVHVIGGESQTPAFLVARVADAATTTDGTAVHNGEVVILGRHDVIPGHWVGLEKLGYVVQQGEDKDDAQLNLGLMDRSRLGRLVGPTYGYVAVQAHQNRQPHCGGLADRGPGEEDDMDQELVAAVQIILEKTAESYERLETEDREDRQQEQVVDDGKTLEEEERGGLDVGLEEDVPRQGVPEQAHETE